MRTGGFRPRGRPSESGRLNVAGLGQVEDAAAVGPLVIALHAFDALGAGQHVAVLGETALGNEGTVDAHGDARKVGRKSVERGL